MLYLNPKVGDRVIGRKWDKELADYILSQRGAAGGQNIQAEFTRQTGTVTKVDGGFNNNPQIAIRFDNNLRPKHDLPLAARFMLLDKEQGIYREDQHV